MKPLSSPADAKLPLSLPWSEQAADAPAAVEAVAPAPPPRPVLPNGKQFKITPMRMAMYGGTIGCKACDSGDPRRMHTPECRARFAEHIAKESRDNVEVDEAACGWEKWIILRSAEARSASRAKPPSCSRCASDAVEAA